MSKSYARFDADAISNPHKRAVAKALIYSANDVKKIAQASMRRANDAETHSKPGEAPFYFKGTLRNLIRWEMANENGTRVRIGPTKVGSTRQSVPRILEKGSTVVPEKTVRVLKDPRPNPRRFSPDSVRDRNVNKYGEHRSGRPFKKKRNPVTKKLERYDYFYSTTRWEAARNSAGFLAWTRTVTEEKRIAKYKVKARPYMKPALLEAIWNGRLATNYANALKNEMKKGWT